MNSEIILCSLCEKNLSLLESERGTECMILITIKLNTKIPRENQDNNIKKNSKKQTGD